MIHNFFCKYVLTDTKLDINLSYMYFKTFNIVDWQMYTVG